MLLELTNCMLRRHSCFGHEMDCRQRLVGWRDLKRNSVRRPELFTKKIAWEPMSFVAKLSLNSWMTQDAGRPKC